MYDNKLALISYFLIYCVVHINLHLYNLLQDTTFITKKYICDIRKIDIY